MLVEVRLLRRHSDIRVTYQEKAGSFNILHHALRRSREEMGDIFCGKISKIKFLLLVASIDPIRDVSG
jgi:hypothetical protein